MKIATAHLTSVSPYSQSAQFPNRPPGVKPEEYEKQMWRERIHADDAGNVFIPPMAFKKALDAAARLRGEKIAGRGQKTYSAFFTSAVLVMDGLKLPVKKNEMDGQWLWMDAQGTKGSGGGTRVQRCFPFVPSWEGKVEYIILDDNTITTDVFERHLAASGQFVGIGRFRPENGGFYGRFAVKSVKYRAG